MSTDKCFAKNCDAAATHRIFGYAEIGQDGGYVWQPVCLFHYELAREMCGEMEDNDDEVYEMFGLEHLTDRADLGCMWGVLE